jgi:hypothetical protein
MCCYHNRGSETGDRGPKTGDRSPSSVSRLPSPVFRLPSFRDDRGLATVEGILVFALLVGVLLGCLLLGQWGIRLQNAQMGARLLTFNAGDASLAKFGRPADTATQTFSTGSWNAYAGALPSSWLNTMFVLRNDRLAGRVKGTQRGRLQSPGGSLFEFSSASIGYFSNSSAASNSWADTTRAARSTFLGIAYYVGRYRVTPQSIGTKPTIPPAIPVLETIYSRIGGR